MRVSTRGRRFAAALAGIVGLGVLGFAAGPASAESTLPLGNPGSTPSDYTSGEEGCEGLDPALNYWHFVVVPNSGAGSFLSITLVLDNGSGETSFTFSGDDLIPNGDQTDNIFVEIPAGYGINIVSGSAVISGTGRVFNLSHTCTADFAPLTASKTAVASYDTNFHWELTKTVSDDSHSGTAGEVAGDSDWTITATQVIDPNTDFKVSGSITINNSNEVAVPVTVTDVLDDGTVAAVVCPAASVPANGSLVCTYSAVPADDSASLNTATIVSGNDDIDGTVATAPVEFGVEDANGDDPVVLTDPHLGLDEETSSTIVRVINEEFPCSSVATDYTDGSYSYTVPNTAFLDGGETHLSASAEVVVDCTLPALTVSKTADGSFDRDLTWTLDKSVNDDSHTGLPGDVFESIWEVDVDLNISDPYNFQVGGDVTISNPSSIDQTFLAEDVLDTGEVVSLNCPTYTVPAGDSVVCTYEQPVADDSATLNTVTVTAAGNDPIEATAPVEFSLDQQVGDTVVDLTDPRRPNLDRLGLLAALLDLRDPEGFVCPARDSGLYVNGTYTETFVNTAFLTGATTNLQDSASVTITCNLERVEGGHTIGYWFNAPAGQVDTLNDFPTLKAQYSNVLGNLSFANKTALKNFGNSANCSGTCTTMLQAQFIATAMSVYNDVNDYGDQCVAVPTYIEADGVAQIDDLLVRINVLFPTLTTAQRIELKTLLDSINNDQPFNLC